MKPSRLASSSEDHADAGPHQLRGRRREELGPVVRVSMLKGKVLAFDVAAIPQAGQKRIPVGAGRLRRARRAGNGKMANAGEISGRLRPGRERRGEEAASNRCNERTSVHERGHGP